MDLVPLQAGRKRLLVFDSSRPEWHSFRIDGRARQNLLRNRAVLCVGYGEMFERMLDSDLNCRYDRDSLRNRARFAIL